MNQLTWSYSDLISVFELKDGFASYMVRAELVIVKYICGLKPKKKVKSQVTLK